jgi:predicted HAD superfamily Cof-like phosphohydrolase
MEKDVKDFIIACEQESNADTAYLYQKLMAEEYAEFLAAVTFSDEVETLDACMDLIWVTLGYCIHKGYDIEGAWNEVARSNMAKVDPETGKVKRRSDGKILKPADWTPPNLAPFVKKAI